MSEVLLCPTAAFECFDLIWFDLGNSLGFSDLTMFIKLFYSVLFVGAGLLLLCEPDC